MSSIRQVVRVRPGNRVEVVATEFREGDLVSVIVAPCESNSSSPAVSIIEFLDSLPDGPRAFPTWDEYERQLRLERESWDR